MPVFEKAVAFLASELHPLPPSPTQDDRERRWPGGDLYAESEKLVRALFQSVDWDRVRLEATGRCLQLHSDEIADMPCGECIEAALLVDETWPTWEVDERGPAL